MLGMPFMVSTIFSLASLTYICIGFYGLSLNIKTKINRIFFLMTLTLAFWTVCYAISTNSLDYNTAVFVNRISVLAWGLYYSVIVHFSKLLSVEHDTLPIKDYVFIYFPSAFFIINVLFNPSIYVFKLVLTPFGYTVITENSLFNIAITVYAILYSLLTVKNLYLWSKKIVDKKLVRLVKITIFLSIFSIIISILADTLVIRILEFPSIQIISILFLVPTICFFYLLLKSRIMHKEFTVDYENLIDDESKETLFRILSYLYIVLAYGSFVINYIYKINFRPEQIIVSLLILFMSFIHFFLTSMFKQEKIQHLLITVIYVFMFVFFEFIYPNIFFENIWLLYFCYMLITIIFKNYLYSLAMYIFICSSYLHAFLNKTSLMAYRFTSIELILKFSIISIFTIVVLYINYSYRKKNSENMSQIEKQVAIREFSKKILEMNVNNISQKLRGILIDLNNNFDIKRSCFIQMDKNNEKEYLRVLITQGNEVYKQSDLSATFFNDDSELLERLYNGEKIEIVNLDYEKGMFDLKEKFRKKGINSFYALPICLDNKLRAILVFECLYSDDNKFLSFYMGTIHNLILDAFKKIDNEQDLIIKANFDEVTGLMNKNYFIKECRNLMASSEKSIKYCLYIDIDDFKSINDSFGHIIGDELLVKTSQILREFANEKLLLTRFTSDEFIIAFSNKYSKEDVKDYAISVINRLKEGLKISGTNFRLNICVGISEYSKDGDKIDDLIKNADLAMNKAKTFGSMKYHFCDATDKNKIIEDSIYTDKLYKALDKKQFVLAYQPQIDLKTEKVIGVEALLRWQTDEFGIIPPNKFIPILEKTGIIISVGEWIIEEAIKEQEKIKKISNESIRMSINLSAVQFMDASLIHTIEILKNKYNVDSTKIEFEITESVAINNSEYIIEGFKSIKSMGFSLAIDDFGTGYSSLNRLQTLPIDRLKIDKSFIDGIGENDKKESIINVIIDLAKNLNLVSIAEGVETKEQIEYLKKHNCQEIQGYYYAKPMFSEDLIEFIKHGCNQ